MIDKRQEQILEKFFKEFLSWDAGNIGQWIVTAVMEFVLGIFMLIPYQTMAQDELMSILFWLCLWGAMFYMMPYGQFTENRKTVKVYEKLKYLPVSQQAIRIFRIKKLAIFCLKAFLVFLIGQLFFSLVVFHEITWGNILYPLYYGFLLPFVVNGITWWWSK